MDYVTWSELVYLLLNLVTLAFVILSYLNSKKKITALTTNLSGYL